MREVRDGSFDRAPPSRPLRSAPELLKPLAAFVEERFRFSRYEPESHFIVDDLRKAIELLKGAGGKKELARLGKLPEIGAPGMKKPGTLA